MGQTGQEDRVIRAMTDDGAFRVIAARTSDTVVGTIEAQSIVSQSDRVLFSELLTSAVLYRETMAPSLRVQCIVQDRQGTPKLLADSHPAGWVRGLFQPEARDQKTGIQDCLLQMMRSLPNGDLHRGVVEVGDAGNLCGAVEGYMQRSEQITSMVSLGVVVQSDTEIVSGGFLVQLLPEAAEAEGALKTMTARLVEFQDIKPELLKNDASPEALIEGLFGGMPHTILQESSVSFGCDCSQVRIMTSLSTLGRKDIEDIINDAEPLEMGCEYCGKSYRIEVAQLRGLLTSS